MSDLCSARELNGSIFKVQEKNGSGFFFFFGFHADFFFSEGVAFVSWSCKDSEGKRQSE